jgi:hypothetical protein
LKRRSDYFQRALKALQQMALVGKPDGIAGLSPFGEHDGIVFVDTDRTIRYMSGIATNLFRIIGYAEPLVGKSLDYLETRDEELVRRAIEHRACVEMVTEERGGPGSKSNPDRSRRARVHARSAREIITGAFLLLP